MAAAALAAAGNEQGWIRFGKKPKTFTDPLQLFELVEILKTKGTGPDAMLTIKGVDSGEEMEKPKTEVFNANPDDKNWAKDLSNLDFLHEAGILHCMRVRFCANDFVGQGVESLYATFIGTICVSVNPFAPMPWSPAWNNVFTIQPYMDSTVKPNVLANHALEPHPWSTADMAFNELMDEKKNQAILICGESGSGKTEACKFVLQYLIGKNGAAVDKLEDKLMATNDPLEAFGNSKTVNNDNSSRFAKCMQICFSPCGGVGGAEIQTSLLEKSRVCAFFQYERNYHSFYMLCYYKYGKDLKDKKGPIDNSDAESMLGAKSYKHCKLVKDYDFLVNGDNMLPPEGDVVWYKRVISSFCTSLGYSIDEKNLMMDILISLLEMGNLHYTDDDKSQIKPECKETCETICDLLQLDSVDEMMSEFCKEEIMMGGALIAKSLNKKKAQQCRDSICRATFNNIFLDIVLRCNISVEGERDKAVGRVGVLDIFGFERMQFNSLEQLCINYTNEKLHQVFINEVFEGEKRVYEAEGIDPGAIEFTDNAMVLEMNSGQNPHDISGKSGATAADRKKKQKKSTFGILDDTCKQDSATDETFCERLVKQWDGAKDANGPLFMKPKFGMEEFSVVHFAGPVKYGVTEVDKTKFLAKSRWAKEKIPEDSPTIDGFTTKNKDKVPDSLVKWLFESSKNAYMVLIFDQQKPKEGEAVDAKAPKTTVSKFDKEIERFFKVLLDGASPKFIRCINPKPKATNPAPTMGGRYNLQRVLGQLLYTGILDTVKVRTAGYAIRKPYSEFACQWVHPCNLLPEGFIPDGVREDHYCDELRADEVKSREVCKTLLEMAEYEVPKKEFEFGNTMIFVKKLSSIAKMSLLKEEMMQEVVLIARATVHLQSMIQKPFWHDPIAPKIKAVTFIAKWWKYFRQRRKWVNIWVEFKTFGAAKPLAENYALGFLQRWKFKDVKAEAIVDGRWNTGGGSLLKKKKKKEPKKEAPVATGIDYSKFADSMPKMEAVPQKSEAEVEAIKAEAEKLQAVEEQAEQQEMAARQEAAVAKAEVAKLVEEAAAASTPEAKAAVEAKQAEVQAKVVAAEAEIKEMHAKVEIAKVEAKKAEDEAIAAANPPKVFNPAKLGPAMGGAVDSAKEACPKTTDEAKLKMRTRDFISKELQTKMVKALRGVNEVRPGDPHTYIAAVLRGEDPPEGAKGNNSQFYEYLTKFGAFMLLKPALLACDAHRPDDPALFIATFLADTVRAAEAE